MGKAFGLRAIEPAERIIQSAILEYLQVCDRVAWAERFNTGAHIVDEPGQRRRWVKYAFKGCADILGQMSDGRFLAIEVKTRTGRVTQEQKQFIALVNAHGGIGILARSLDDVLEALS